MTEKQHISTSVLQTKRKYYLAATADELQVKERLLIGTQLYFLKEVVQQLTSHSLRSNTPWIMYTVPAIWIWKFEVVAADPFLLGIVEPIYLQTPEVKICVMVSQPINGFQKQIFSQFYCLQNNPFSKIEHYAG